MSSKRIRLRDTSSLFRQNLPPFLKFTVNTLPLPSTVVPDANPMIPTRHCKFRVADGQNCRIVSGQDGSEKHSTRTAYASRTKIGLVRGYFIGSRNSLNPPWIS